MLIGVGAITTSFLRYVHRMEFFWSHGYVTNADVLTPTPRRSYSIDLILILCQVKFIRVSGHLEICRDDGLLGRS